MARSATRSSSSRSDHIVVPGDRLMRVLVTVGLLLVLAVPVGAQVSRGGTRPGDSVWVIVHHVRADKRAQYYSLMQHVWWPATQRAGKKHPAYGKSIAGRRRYVPTEVRSDSTCTYL